MTQFERLTNNFLPNHYDLQLDLSSADKRNFSGRVVIDGELLAGQTNLKIHAKDLTIEQATIDGQPASHQLEEYDQLVLSREGLEPGEHKVELAFSGKITDPMHGLYPCYFKHDGMQKELLATQFESHHAREVFPCVDEPAAKATFDLTLVTRPEVETLSNMPIASQSTDGDKMTTSFQTTPVMSSYLLAFVVGEMQKKTTKTKRGVEVNAWSTPAQPIESLDFALDIASRTIDFYEEYFGIEYPLPKCDNVALPDFSSGAMENWGLVTYRETAMLANPKTAGVADKHYVALVIAHELAHQWFGNLVTMEWWDYLWLNESFADFVEHIAVDTLHPEWETWLDMTMSRGIAALRRDAMDGVQSVQVKVEHPDEISTIFDGAIVYGKGARLMKMLRAYVGDDAFRSGLKDYFTKYAYKNTVGDDLWECLGKSSGKDVSKFMHTWITQPGYPMLEVEKDQLRQTQFFIGEHQPSQKLWPILLSSNPTGDGPEIMDRAKMPIQIQKNQRLNSGDTGHYIVKYDENYLKSLLENISDAPTIDRLTLLHDQTLLIRGGYESSDKLVDLLKYYEHETNDSVWDMMALALGELKKFVENDKEAEKALRRLSGRIARRTFEKLGYEKIDGEPLTDTKLRGTALAMMLYGEDEEAVEHTLSLFDIENLDRLPAEIRSLVISNKVRYQGDDATVQALVDLYASTPSAELKEDLASGITSTRSPEIAEKLLNNLHDSQIVRPQDAVIWFIYLVRGRETRETAWGWLRNNWDWVVKTYDGDKSYDEFPRYAASGLMNRRHLQEYMEFFEPMNEEPSLKRTIALGIADIKARVELIERDGEAVTNRLKGL